MASSARPLPAQGRDDMNRNNQISYVEFPAKDLEATKTFFQTVFGWSFEDYGPEYTAFSGQGIDGGFFHADLASSVASGGALVVIYSDMLEALQEQVSQAGGLIVRPIFSFPGGRRFHFKEPSGNEMAVWSDTGG